MLFVPNKEEETPQVPIEKELCVYSAPLQVSPTPTPISEADLNPYAEACMAYSEAGNQSFDGQVAVVQVALNRYMHEAYSGSISDILFSPCQFVVGDYYGSVQMEAVDAALAGHPALDLNTDVVYFSTGSLTYGSYYKTIGDHVFRTYI
jgi:spore germination cell wall hydrolase CwlJ-like protein